MTKFYQIPEKDRLPDTIPRGRLTRLYKVPDKNLRGTVTKLYKIPEEDDEVSRQESKRKLG